MLKTNTLIVRNAVKNYLLICMDFSNYEGYKDYTIDEQKPFTTCYNIFVSEYGFNIKRIGRYKAFSDWLRGLPSALSVDFYYDEERQLLKQWLQQTDAESEKYSDDKTDALYWQLLTMEFFKQYDKENK